MLDLTQCNWIGYVVQDYSNVADTIQL